MDAADTATLAETSAAAAAEIPAEPEVEDELQPLAPRYAPRVLDARNAYIMNTMLKDVVRRGTGRRALVLERADLAGKLAPLTMVPTPGSTATAAAW